MQLRVCRFALVCVTTNLLKVEDCSGYLQLTNLYLPRVPSNSRAIEQKRCSTSCGRKVTSRTISKLALRSCYKWTEDGQGDVLSEYEGSVSSSTVMRSKLKKSEIACLVV